MESIPQLNTGRRRWRRGLDWLKAAAGKKAVGGLAVLLGTAGILVSSTDVYGTLSLIGTDLWGHKNQLSVFHHVADWNNTTYWKDGAINGAEYYWFATYIDHPAMNGTPYLHVLITRAGTSGSAWSEYLPITCNYVIGYDRTRTRWYIKAGLLAQNPVLGCAINAYDTFTVQVVRPALNATTGTLAP